MTVFLRPIGRGNWKTESIEISEGRILPMLLKVGTVMEWGGWKFRIVEVRP